MATAVELEMLKQRLNKLGVDVSTLGGAHAAAGEGHTSTTLLAQPAGGLQVTPKRSSAGAGPSEHRSSKQEVAELLERIGHVESGLRAADHLAHAAAARLSKAAGSPVPELRKSKSPTASRPARKALVKAPKATHQVAVAGSSRAHAAAGGGGGGSSGPAALRASVAPGPPKGALGPHTEMIRGVPPHTPLSTVLHQYKEAEVVWAHEKAQLRREAVEQRRRANKADAEVRRLGRMLEHKTLDVKSLRSALKNRDTQLDAAIERIKELETLLLRTQEDAAARAGGLVAERDDCKALLLATLQRLEAVDEVVHRADVSSSMMQDKMKVLEEERLRALEAAARARSEVAELTESRRKLQWQSKLLEKMSEVQLRHNKRKSDALKKLLATDQGGEGGGGGGGGGGGVPFSGLDGHSLGTTDLDPQAFAGLEDDASIAEALMLHRAAAGGH